MDNLKNIITTEERILTQVATIKIALNKISDICRDWQEGNKDAN